jgi:hypothetical protein
MCHPEVFAHQDHTMPRFSGLVALATAILCVTGPPLVSAKTTAPKAPQGPPATAPVSYDALIESAVDARRSGDLATSAELLRKAHTLEPSGELMNNLGRVLEEDGKYREAFETYRSVANDPTADRSLRALDASRMAALQPKIGRAWIVPNISPNDATVYLDGVTVGATPATVAGDAMMGMTGGSEHATGPTRTTLEILVPEATDIVIRQPAPPIGERSAYLEDASAIAPTDARINLAGISPAPTEITIDGQALRGDVSTRTMLRLPAGEHQVGVTLPGFEPETHTITLEPDSEVAIAPLLVKTTKVAVEVWGPTPMPWIVLAGGVAVAAVGGGLLGAASMEQPTFNSQNVTSMTQVEAQERNERAATLSTAGIATLIAGGSAALGGLVWWLIHESNRPRESAAPTAIGWLSPTDGGATAGMVLTW